MEAEYAFITFEELLDRLEDMICDVVDRVLKSKFGYLVKELNPDFKIPRKPFKRMDYKDAIEYLQINNITKDDGTFYEFGEVHSIKLFDYCFAIKFLSFVLFTLAEKRRERNNNLFHL